MIWQCYKDYFKKKSFFNVKRVTYFRDTICLQKELLASKYALHKLVA